MRLLIISHTEHYLRGDQPCGWGSTVREIDQLAGLFTEVHHIACLYPGSAPDSMLPYGSGNIHLIPVPPVGGSRLIDKISIFRLFPLYARTILRELSQADVIHIRAPANISLLAMVMLAFVKNPQKRWIKYAGNWNPGGREPVSYSFQRWWLKKDFARARVTVNGDWPEQPAHVHPFINPCLTEQERREAADRTAGKSLNGTLRLVFAGRVEQAKGIEMVLKILAGLREEGIPATLDIAGDSPERPIFERMSRDLGLQDVVCFLGWLPRTELSRIYAGTHLIVLPTLSEGWPKVLSEAMAYGVVPIASDVGSIGQYLRQYSVGKALVAEELKGFLDAVRYYMGRPEAWKADSDRARAVAVNFTYEAYLKDVKHLLGLP